uniref:F-box associated beta-propeller type 3 domain-containing protein n=1 Tax=Solanum lycopersicum TaxID=4081 RepID=A0A3Q7EB39_SOLLC
MFDLFSFYFVNAFQNSVIPWYPNQLFWISINVILSGQNSFCSKKEFITPQMEKKGGKTSASVLQLDTFNNPCLNSVNGLFCGWESSYMQPAAIFNPSTKQVRFLPNPTEGKSWNKCSIPEENKYKVLLTTYNTRDRHTKYWIFTLGIDKLWRDTHYTFPCIPFTLPNVCISGVIYQLFMVDYISIVAFDVKSQKKIEIITLWNTIESVYYYQLIEVKDKSGITGCRKWVSGYFDLWILEKTPTGVPSIWNNTEPKSVSFFMARNLCWMELKIKGLPKENNIKGIYSYVGSLVPFGYLVQTGRRRGYMDMWILENPEIIKN